MRTIYWSDLVYFGPERLVRSCLFTLCWHYEKNCVINYQKAQLLSYDSLIFHFLFKHAYFLYCGSIFDIYLLSG